MKRFASIFLAACLTVFPAAAQDSREDMREGFDLLEQGTRLLFQGLISEIGPALKEFENMVIDLNAYHAPEILPNGDIIIRRKVPLQPEDGEIDL